MTTILEQAVTALQSLPDDRRNELAQVILDATMPTIEYGEEHLTMIDAGLKSANAGRFATADQVNEIFAKFRPV